MKVEVAYRSSNPEELEIFHEGFEPRKIKPLKITEHTNPRRSILPAEENPPATSRELDAATREYEKHKDFSQTAISYRSLVEGERQ